MDGDAASHNPFGEEAPAFDTNRARWWVKQAKLASGNMLTHLQTIAKSEGATVEEIDETSWLINEDGGRIELHWADDGDIEWAMPSENWRLSFRGVIQQAMVVPSQLLPGPRKFLYGENFLRQKLTVIGGNGGIAKSTMCMTIGIAMAAGRPSFGMYPKEGQLRVGYISTEDEVEELHRVSVVRDFGTDGGVS